MQTSVAGIALIKRLEGLELVAYHDIAGVLTIGYGHTSEALNNASMTGGLGVFADYGGRFNSHNDLAITEEGAEALLRKDLDRFEKAVRNAVLVALNQNEFDALVSFTFNVGISALRKSTALKRLNRGDYVGAAEALTWWNKARVDGRLQVVEGLRRRRAAERALFLTPVPETVLADRSERVCPAREAPPLTERFRL